MEKKILSLFLFNKELKFSEIEKQLSIRSNKLAYHLHNLIKKEILIKTGEAYKLSDASENIIPYLSENQSPLPVLLIHLGNKNKAFLYKREKRPYKDYLSLPGGRLLNGESIIEAAKRIMLKKFNIRILSPKIKLVSLEHVKTRGRTVYSFLLILIKAETKEKISFFNIDKNKKKIIQSDYFLIKSQGQNNLNVKVLVSRNY
ncbi:MAG: hypothetical protein Q8Q31_00940 [Nanoarchaeota archaeon]|nr:hypothetical protein [Nanoarchaeota archaeon]